MMFSKMLIAAVALSGARAQEVNPCTVATTTLPTTVTTTPAETKTTTPKPPCSTVTTTPAPTCGSFACPSGFDSNPEDTVCANGKCTEATCCVKIITTVTTTPKPPCSTVTTTPAPTCGSFTCPYGYDSNPEDTVCANGKCTKLTCCVEVTTTKTTTPKPPCSTVTTTPAPTCGSFTCPSGFNSNPEDTVCANGKCTEATCCTVIVTTKTTTPKPPCSTVTTTPAPTCGSYTCPAGFTSNSEDTVCANGKCTTDVCCQAPTQTTTPPPTCGTFTCPADAGAVPADRENLACTNGKCTAKQCCNICAPPKNAFALPRLYADKSVDATAPKESSAAPAWAFPLFGVVAMFSFVSFFAVRSRRQTRQIQYTEPQSDVEAFLSEDAGAE